MLDLLNKFITHNTVLNSLEQVEDNTVIKCKALIMHFNKSFNGWAVKEDVVKQRMSTLINKPIVARYYSEEENNGLDALGDHEPTTIKLRGTNGEVDLPSTNTKAIGVTTNVYIDYIDPQDHTLGKGLWAEGIIWALDNINETSLLLEWFSNNIPILLSVEWYYSQETFMDNTRWILDPTFSAVCLLNSELRGEKPIYYGNYDVAHLDLLLNQQHYNSFNQAVKADLEKGNSFNDIENKIENGDDRLENIFLKALNDISFGEIRDKIYSALAKVMIAEEYNSMWISLWDVYDTYFIYETYNGTEWVRFKINYTKGENDELVVDYENRKQVVRQDVYVEVSEVQSLNTKIDELTQELNGKAEEFNNKVEELNVVNVEKESLNETIIGLNSQIEELKPYKETVDAQEYEKALNEKKEYYSEKFNAMGAKEKYESEDVQNLIKQTLNSDEGMKAELQLNKMIVEMVQATNSKKETNSQNNYKELNSKMDGLIPTKENFVDNYGFDIN